MTAIGDGRCDCCGHDRDVHHVLGWCDECDDRSGWREPTYDDHAEHVRLHVALLDAMPRPTSTGRPSRWRRLLLRLGFRARPGEIGYFVERQNAAIARHMEAHCGLNSVARGEKP